MENFKFAHNTVVKMSQQAPKELQGKTGKVVGCATGEMPVIGCMWIVDFNCIISAEYPYKVASIPENFLEPVYLVKD